jgi:hypothetical protein
VLTTRRISRLIMAAQYFGLTACSNFAIRSQRKKSALIKALYRYCELDTLAMVFILEFFNEKVNKGR